MSTRTRTSTSVIAPSASQTAMRALPDPLHGLRALRTTRRTLLRELTAQVDAQSAQLRAFAVKYEAQLGDTLLRLDAARAALDEWQRRRDAARESPQALADLDTTLQAHAASAANQADSERALRAALADATTSVGDIASVEPDPDDVRSVYRRLAQRHHPDLADDEDERAEREAAMQRINTALQQRDLTQLREIEQEQEDEQPGTRRSSTPRDIATVLRDLARYDLAIAQHRARFAAQQAGSLFRLWQRCQREPRLLHWLAAATRRELQELELACMALQRDVADLCRQHEEAQAQVQAQAHAHAQSHAAPQRQLPTEPQPQAQVQPDAAASDGAHLDEARAATQQLPQPSAPEARQALPTPAPSPTPVTHNPRRRFLAAATMP